MPERDAEAGGGAGGHLHPRRAVERPREDLVGVRRAVEPGHEDLVIGLDDLGLVGARRVADAAGRQRRAQRDPFVGGGVVLGALDIGAVAIGFGPDHSRATVEDEQCRAHRVGGRIAHPSACSRPADHLPSAGRFTRHIDLVVAVAAVGPRHVAHAARVRGDGRVQRRTDAAGDAGARGGSRDLGPPPVVGRTGRQRVHGERIVGRHRHHRIRRRHWRHELRGIRSLAGAEVDEIARPERVGDLVVPALAEQEVIATLPVELVAAGTGFVQVGPEVAIQIIDRIVVARRRIVAGDDVVVGPTHQDVLARTALDEVVSRAAVDDIVARAADQDVVAAVAEDVVAPVLARNAVPALVGTLEHVVAGAAEDDIDAARAGAHLIVTVLAEQDVVAGATVDAVLTIAAVDVVAAESAQQHVNAITAVDEVAVCAALDMVVAGTGKDHVGAA